MNKKELKKAYEEGILAEEQYKQELFKLETSPKIKRKPHKLPVAVSPDEFSDIMKVTKYKHHKLAFYLGWMIGLRVSEVIKLKPNDFDFQYGSIRIENAKGGKDRIVPIPKSFRQELLKELPLIPKHFKNEKSGIRSIQIAFKRACKKSGMLEKKPGLKFHSLRHGFATNALDKGIPIHDVRTLMGHANISTTNIYLEANPKKAIANYQELF